MYVGEELEMIIINKIKKYQKDTSVSEQFTNGATTALRDILTDIQSTMGEEDEEGDDEE
jgi:hypothetical protein